MMKIMATYETDGYGWALETAAALREGRFEGVDWESVAEELEGVAKTERNTLQSNLMQVLLHMLKFEYQPEMRTRSWELSLVEHRGRVRDVLQENPSLKPSREEVLAKAYYYARLRAANQTGIALSALPLECPWSFAQVQGE